MQFIPILIAFLRKNLIPVIGAGLIVLIVMLVFNHWKESLIESGREEVRQQWSARDADTAKQSAELIKRKTQEAEAINEFNKERQTMRCKSMQNTMTIFFVLLLMHLSGCTSIPKQQVAVETPCPDQVKVSADLVKDLRESLKPNYRQAIYDSLTQ